MLCVTYGLQDFNAFSYLKAVLSIGTIINVHTNTTTTASNTSSDTTTPPPPSLPPPPPTVANIALDSNTEL